jgi:hypothetical protein
MTRKRCYLISAAVLVACVCVALGVLAMLPAQSGVTKANFDRIELGMTLAEVEGIFGHDGDKFDVLGDEHRENIFWGASPYNGDMAVITFSNDLVCERHWGNELTFSDKLRRWLHLPPAE